VNSHYLNTLKIYFDKEYNCKSGQRFQSVKNTENMGQQRQCWHTSDQTNTVYCHKSQREKTLSTAERKTSRIVVEALSNYLQEEETLNNHECLPQRHVAHFVSDNNSTLYRIPLLLISWGNNSWQILRYVSNLAISNSLINCHSTWRQMWSHKPYSMQKVLVFQMHCREIRFTSFLQLCPISQQ